MLIGIFRFQSANIFTWKKMLDFIKYIPIYQDD